jgi:DNA-binding transcriptional ArsR family regulator
MIAFEQEWEDFQSVDGTIKWLEEIFWGLSEDEKALIYSRLSDLVRHHEQRSAKHAYGALRRIAALGDKFQLDLPADFWRATSIAQEAIDADLKRLPEDREQKG